jgi:hypothetical protein
VHAADNLPLLRYGHQLATGSLFCGIGPTAIQQLREVLATAGLSFATKN